MSDTLYPYYERELAFIRLMAQDFARQYPASAGRLLLEPNRSADPHVERLIESFALIAGRIHHKLDDEFPELTDALLSILYPHYIAPVPSMAIVQLLLDPARGQLPKGFRLAPGARLHTPPLDGQPCRFRTCYPVTLWPIEVTSARLQGPPFPPGLTPPPRTAAVLRIQLECLTTMKFADLELQQLRFFLYGDGPLTAPLYETIFNHTLQVVLRSGDRTNKAAPIVLSPAECLRQVGFDAEDALLPYGRRSFRGYALLTELFCFPSKFLFVDVAGFDAAAKAGFDKKLEIVLFLSRTTRALEQGVTASTLRLGCTPVVNLFEQTAEPIALSQARHEYKIVPDVHQPQGLEVYSVDRVTGANPSGGGGTEYHPFYSFRHGVARDTRQAFWYASRRSSPQEGDQGSDVYLHLVDLGFDPRLPAESTLIVRTTCTNRDLPARLQGAGEALHLSLEATAPLSGIRCLRTPTAPLRPGRRRGRYWRLVSHLSLNYLSLADGEEGCEALKEILRLYDFSDPHGDQTQLASVVGQLIEGITALRSRRVVARTGGEAASGFCRGVEVTLDFDEKKYLGTGVFLFASVLERFLGLYATVNSFSQLVGKVQSEEGPFKKWPPRAGEQPLL
jgi:type VI secretion system protein ImpG